MGDYTAHEFDLTGALDRLAARICRDIKSPKKRQMVAAELRAHLEDAAEDIMRRGNPPEVAFAELERSLGDTDKISTLLASVHNTRHIPALLPWLGGAALLGGAVYLYLTAESDVLRAWIGVGLQLLAMAAITALALAGVTWLRAIRKRASALRRLKQYVKENGGTLTRLRNGYRSLIVRGTSPELTVDMGDRRYILSLWATVQRRRTLHLQDNGIYSYDKHFGYMLASPGIAPYARFFRPKGMERDAWFTWYHSEMVKLPEGAHLMPEVDYGSCFAPDKVNIPILVLNPIPLDVEICENGRVHKVAEGDTLPAALGGARLYSMSGFISLLEEIRIFGREGGQREGR